MKAICVTQVNLVEMYNGTFRYQVSIVKEYELKFVFQT